VHSEAGDSGERERCDTRPVTGSDGRQLGRDEAQATKPQLENEHSRKDRARQRLAAARRRYEGSWVQDLRARLKALDLVNWTTVFGAELLWSVLPLLILLSSLANERVDDDVSRHIGVNAEGAHIVRGLFRNSPTLSLVPILTGLIFAIAGTIAVAGSLQVLYERAFDIAQRKWRDIPRAVAWLVVLLGALVAEGTVSKPVRTTTGLVVELLVRFVAALIFFWWTMHFLLAGRAMACPHPARPGHRAAVDRSRPVLFDQPVIEHRLGQQAVRNDRRRLHAPDLVHPDRHRGRARRGARCCVAGPERSRFPGRRLRYPPERGQRRRTRGASRESC